MFATLSSNPFAALVSHTLSDTSKVVYFQTLVNIPARRVAFGGSTLKPRTRPEVRAVTGRIWSILEEIMREMD